MLGGEGAPKINRVSGFPPVLSYGPQNSDNKLTSAVGLWFRISTAWRVERPEATEPENWGFRAALVYCRLPRLSMRYVRYRGNRRLHQRSLINKTL